MNRHMENIHGIAVLSLNKMLMFINGCGGGGVCLCLGCAQI